MFGQIGIFGPVSAQLKAGDFAPEIVFKRVLNAGAAAPWSPANLAGHVTVLAFYPDTSHNLQSVSRWNSLVEQFADTPVQFAWITAEEESTLLPWLHEHPVKGWVFHDPDGATGRSYGMELPAGVIIGNDRGIVGFDQMIVPTARTLNAALEGRITTVPLKPGAAAFQAFVESSMVLLKAEPPRMLRPDDHRPDLSPSYTLHVSPAKGEGGGNFGGADFWSFQDFELKDLIAELYDINPVRIHLPTQLDDGKCYDFAIVLPEPESKENIYNRIRHGIEEHFRVTATHEERLLDVYVVTAPNGRPPAAKTRLDDELDLSWHRASSVEFQVSRVAGGPDEFADVPKAVSIDDIRGISLVGTMDEFCRTLERQLDRPVVNGTNLDGEFAFRVEASAGIDNDFLERLRVQLDLSVTPAQRRVQIVVLKPR